MADVAQKSINANNVKSGTATVKTNNSNYQKLDANPDKSPTIADIEDDLTNRFDDPTYYTA